MAVAVAVWSAAVKPGEPEELVPQSDLRITNIALSDDLADESGRTTIKLHYRTPIAPEESEEDEEEQEVNLSTTVLCSLTPGKIEQAVVDVILEGDEEYLIEVVGKNTVYFTGNYIDQTPPDQVPYNDESDYDSDEEGYDLRDVSSDVEIDPNEMDVPSDDEGRFEEITDEADAPKSDASKKRPRDSDAMETEGGEPKLSKAEKKKQKKLKAADGKAVPTGTTETSPAKVNGEAGEKKEGAKEKKSKKDKEKKEGSEKKSDGEEKELSGGIKIKDHKIGSGPQAKNGNMVSMRYVGKLQNGKVFDKNTTGAPFKFRLGKGEVIKGWDIGIAGMQAGGERLLTIPPHMAYGSKKMADIPANSTLIFEVKLVKIN